MSPVYVCNFCNHEEHDRGCNCGCGAGTEPSSARNWNHMLEAHGPKALHLYYVEGGTPDQMKGKGAVISARVEELRWALAEALYDFHGPQAGVNSSEFYDAHIEAETALLRAHETSSLPVSGEGSQQ